MNFDSGINTLIFVIVLIVLIVVLFRLLGVAL